MERRKTSIFSGMLRNLAIVAAFVVAGWFVASLAGYSFALWGSLFLSLVLTAVVNLVINVSRLRLS